jgi:acyl-CoA thioesterase-1
VSKSSSRLNPFAISVLAFCLMALSNTAQAQIVAFGASNVSGWGVSANEAFPAQLQSMLRANGYGIRVKNAGVYGATTGDMRNRMNVDIPRGTTIVILDMSGGYFNNFIQGIGREQGRADMDAVMAGMRSRGIKIVPESTLRMPASYKQKDSRHLTAEGHKFLASRLLPKVIEALNRRPDTPS